MTRNVTMDYPALYEAATEASNSAQRSYLRVLRIEYLLLVLAAVFSIDFSENKIYYLFYTFIFVISLVLLVYRTFSKPEQDWYKCRALAESIKTTTWRYCMRSAPFNNNLNDANINITRSAFRDYLKGVLDSNRHIGDRIPPNSAADDQITSNMENIRLLDLGLRKDFYLLERIVEQRLWYQNKAAKNEAWSRNWALVSGFIYLLAIGSILTKLAYGNSIKVPTEPLIVLASCLIGWMQIKKFNELSSAYKLTAHEIGILQGRIGEVTNDDEFSDFVNEAELAFSREHTQWVARQHQ